MVIGDRIRIITEEEYRIMSPPRRPRGEKPATTIRWQRRQMDQMEQIIHQLRIAADDKEKIIAGYDVELSEAQDEIKSTSEMASFNLHRLDQMTARASQSAERLAFLEGYYAKSQETISIPSPYIPCDPTSAYPRSGPGNQENISPRRQTGAGEGLKPGPAGTGEGFGGKVWSEPSNHPAHTDRRSVEHIEITEARDGIERFTPFPPGNSWGA